MARSHHTLDIEKIQYMLVPMQSFLAGQNFLGTFAMEIGTMHVFFLWSDIQEYRAIPTVDFRYTKAKQVNSYWNLTGGCCVMPAME